MNERHGTLLYLVRAAAAAAVLVLFSAVAPAVAQDGAPGDAAAAWHWEQGDGFAALGRGDETLWRFNYGPGCTKPCFHPLNLPGLGTLTWKSPPDHPWHLALWFSWKYINGLNYWEEDRETGKSQGLTRWGDVKATLDADHSARFEMDVVYEPPGQAPVMTEKRIVEVSPPDARGEYHVDWTATFTAGPQDVVLDRTPLPSEEGGKAFGGYAGLSVRFAREFVDWKAVDSDGQIQEQAERIRIKARAVDYGGTLEGKAAGVAVLDHPQNLNAPSPWYIICSPRQPMAYFSPAVIHDGPHTLAAGQSMTLRYRVLVHRGHMEPDALRRHHERFAASAGGK